MGVLQGCSARLDRLLHFTAQWLSHFYAVPRQLKFTPTIWSLTWLEGWLEDRERLRINQRRILCFRDRRVPVIKLRPIDGLALRSYLSEPLVHCSMRSHQIGRAHV